MPTFYEVAGITAAFFALADIVIYILAIFGLDYRLRRTPERTVPNRVTWFIWASLGAILAASYWASGATDTLWFAVVYATGFFIIALLSIRYGQGGPALVDVLSFLGAVISGWAWWKYNSPEVALYATIGIDMFGAVPTIKKSWYQPGTENRPAWLLALLGSIANVLALDWTDTSFAIAAYPLYMLLTSGLIYGFLLRQQSK